MKNKSVIQRQNDKSALKLLKASYRCLRNERIAKYSMLFLSFGICIAAILNKYLPKMAPGVDGIVEIQAKAATYINLISGVILVLGIAIGFYASRMHTEGIVLRDRFEAFVFDNPPNLAMLRPIAQTVINMYSQKIKKKDEAFRNALFDPADDPDSSTAQFAYINREVHSDYRLYISVQPFFLTVWIGFCVIVILLAMSFNDKFIETLINIMIPSLSAISTIGNSWHSCRQQIRELQNLLAVIDQIQRLPDEKRLAYISDKDRMRELADGLFAYRSSAFVIPNFLVRRHLKQSAAQSITLQSPFDDKTPKTEMPGLMLPDLEDESEVSEIVRSDNRIRTVTFSPEHRVGGIKGSDKRYSSRRPAAEGRAAQKPRDRAADLKGHAAKDKK